MIAVIFEAYPAEGKRDEYFDIAEKLRLKLIGMEGFISIERYQSIANPNKVLSLSFWKDQKSIEQWRNVKSHRQAQATGIKSVFIDYRLRVADVLRDYGMIERTEAPSDSKSIHDK